MKHTGLIRRVIESVVLYEGLPKGKFTSSESKPLVKDDNGEPASGMFGYISVSGMILYHYVDTRSDVSLAVNSCARYVFIPKRSHELPLNRVEPYLKQTKDFGLVLNPNAHVCKLDTYPDANFFGMYGY